MALQQATYEALSAATDYAAGRMPAGVANGNGAALARALGWFSIGLGLVEAITPRSTARLIGTEGYEGLVRAFGLREIASGLGILAGHAPAPRWLWARTAGDAMDLSLLGAAAAADGAKRGRVAVAAAAVAGVAFLDAFCARHLGQDGVAVPAQSALPAEDPVGVLRPVFHFAGAMPTGVTVSQHGRIFVNFPKWGDEVAFTVAELRDGKLIPYPDAAANRTDSNDPAAALVSVQSIVVDPADRLWILDTGSPLFQPTRPGGPKLVCVDLATDRIVKKILFPSEVALPTTYLNDVRFDLRRGAEGMAFITDSSDQGPNGIIVVDLASGESWRRLNDHPSTKAEQPANFLPLVEGRPFLERQPDGTTKPVAMGADGIAIGADGSRLYYCPLASRRLYSVATDALCERARDEAAVAATVKDEGDKGGGADGLESDAAGNIYATDYEHNAILRRRPDGEWETVAHDPRLLWPDTLSLAPDGYLYVTANQLQRQARYQGGQDLRRKPYTLFRIRVDAEPVRLR
jgi:sugar lactone lactonase YvrE